MKNVIILGSGRSGTSMLTGSLANSGYFLGENADYLGKNRANPKGFFEDFEVNTINEDILKLSLPVLPEKLRKNLFPTYTFYRARWLARLPLRCKIKITPSLQNRIEKLVVKEPYCFKDPRFSYTFPVWKEYFNKNTRYLVIYRNPAHTVTSILRECSESPDLKNLKINERIALRIWQNMYNHILKNFKKSAHQNHWLFVHYEQIFDSRKVTQVEDFLGVNIDSNFPNKKISRSREIKVKYNSRIQEIYSELNELANYKPTV